MSFKFREERKKEWGNFGTSIVKKTKVRCMIAFWSLRWSN